MNSLRLNTAIFILLVSLNLSCTSNTTGTQAITDVVEVIRNNFAPDKRTALFNITVIEDNSEIIIEGQSNLPIAVKKLKEALNEKGIKFTDKIEILPAASLEDKTKGVINISVANLRSEPKHAAELATQATLGTPVNVLKKMGSWYFVQTPDNYLSWVDEGGIVLMNSTLFESWRSTEKIIYTNTYGHAYKSVEKENRLSDLVAGSIMELVDTVADQYQIKFPDGRIGFISIEEAKKYAVWANTLEPNADALIATSQSLMGVPYLWGGTSTKGVDCSGFTKTIYFLNGMVIPRDASQQVHAGKFIDSIANFNTLEKGDLMFFGRKSTDSTAEKVVHVGMWIGNNQFIHSSDLVRISSVDKSAPDYDAYNVGRYLRSKRLLKQQDVLLTQIKNSQLFKD